MIIIVGGGDFQDIIFFLIWQWWEEFGNRIYYLSFVLFVEVSFCTGSAR